MGRHGIEPPVHYIKDMNGFLWWFVRCHFASHCLAILTDNKVAKTVNFLISNIGTYRSRK